MFVYVLRLTRIFELIFHVTIVLLKETLRWYFHAFLTPCLWFYMHFSTISNFKSTGTCSYFKSLYHLSQLWNSFDSFVMGLLISFLPISQLKLKLEHLLLIIIAQSLTVLVNWWWKKKNCKCNGIRVTQKKLQNFGPI